MARQLEEFSFWHSSTHPWEEWLNGSIWELQPGEDFDCKMDSLRAGAVYAARTRGGKVRTRQFHGRLILQFFKP